jgi:DNA-binding NarL/FixJ family response regulator
VDRNSPNLGKTSEPPADLVRVLVVDDHPLLREGVAAMLMGKSDLAIVGAADGGDQPLMMSPNSD